ncbi:MAG: hypothetical protein RQ715_09200 [Methylococcales bacterium]|nr:hypothetical protein [Methylococcales bacterium]
MERKRGLSRGLEALLKDDGLPSLARAEALDVNQQVQLLHEAEQILALLSEIETGLSAGEDAQS